MKLLPSIHDLKRAQVGLVLLACLALAVSGCAYHTHHRDAASSTQTATVKTTNAADNAVVANTTVPAQPAAATSSTTTTTTSSSDLHDDDHHHHGPIGSVFHVIGAVIAFPFLLIGNLVTAIT
jgi:hypothetical protein